MILDQIAISQLGENLHLVYAPFDKRVFIEEAMKGIELLSITERSKHIAETLRIFLPATYSEAIKIILKSLTPPLEETEGNGLAVLFYMPHCSYVA